MTCKYTSKQLLQEDYPEDADVEEVHSEITGTWRWGTEHREIYRVEDKYYDVRYRAVPDDGIQWGYCDEYPVEVSKVEKIITITEWVPV